MARRDIKLRLVNTLSYTEDVLTIPIEESLEKICIRYLKHNLHARSYLWKDIDGRVLNMDLNLEGNEMQADLEEIDYLEITEDEMYIPTIFLHFKDDLTFM